MPFQNDKTAVAPEDGWLVSLEDANGNALNLTSKSIRIKELPSGFDRIKVVEVVDGVQKPREVEEFIFVCIRNPKVMRIQNTGNKFNSDLQELIKPVSAAA